MDVVSWDWMDGMGGMSYRAAYGAVIRNNDCM